MQCVTYIKTNCNYIVEKAYSNIYSNAHGIANTIIISRRVEAARGTGWVNNVALVRQGEDLGFDDAGFMRRLWKARAAWEEMIDASKPASMLARLAQVPAGLLLLRVRRRRRQGPADHGAGGEAARRLREERGAPDVPGCSKQPARVPPVAAAAARAAATALKSHVNYYRVP